MRSGPHQQQEQDEPEHAGGAIERTRQTPRARGDAPRGVLQQERVERRLLRCSGEFLGGREALCETERPVKVRRTARKRQPMPRHPDQQRAEPGHP
jgi:hypothetical protein